MKEILYCADRDFLEQYLKERASASIGDYKTAASSDLWGKSIPVPGTEAAVNEIYKTDGDTAHIKIEGQLSVNGPDTWDLFFGYGGASYKTIQAAMAKAKNDPMIQRVIFDIDSPGGTLAGCDETWQAHKELASVKTTTVNAGSMLASAAYHIAAPADAIYANSPASRIGSIGILVAAYDWSKYEENLGVKEIIITSSNAPDKHPDVSTKQGRDTIKAQLDALERIFYSHVSEGRGVTTEHIAEHFGRGGLLVARDPSKEHEDAIRSGMIDGVRSIDTEKVKSLSGEKNTPALAGKTQEGQIMKLSEYLEANPAAGAEIEKLKHEAKAAGAEEAKADYSARVDKVLPIIQSAAYPASIKAIACNVLAGKEEMATFTATVAVFDSGKEAAASAEAQKQTQELGAVGAESPNFKNAAEQELDAALKAEVDKRKVK